MQGKQKNQPKKTGKQQHLWKRKNFLGLSLRAGDTHQTPAPVQTYPELTTGSSDLALPNQQEHYGNRQHPVKTE